MNAARITMHRYAPDMAAEWNDFVARSKNGTFLFDRRYMDYHAGRFADASSYSVAQVASRQSCRAI